VSRTLFAYQAGGDDSVSIVTSPTMMAGRTHSTTTADSEAKSEFIDPFCGMSVTPDSTADQRLSVGVPVYFCSSKCADECDARDRAH
jgi:YHS domain-containing protein